MTVVLFLSGTLNGDGRRMFSRRQHLQKRNTSGACGKRCESQRLLERIVLDNHAVVLDVWERLLVAKNERGWRNRGDPAHAVLRYIGP